MSQLRADAIWNRAALEAGGDSPEAGDVSLASLLLAHGLVMNGGVHHATDCLSPEELAAAVSGYSYFGLSDAGDVLVAAAQGPLSPWTDENEAEADRRYRELVPNDEAISNAFETTLSDRPHDFARIAV